MTGKRLVLERKKHVHHLCVWCVVSQREISMISAKFSELTMFVYWSLILVMLVFFGR